MADPAFEAAAAGFKTSIPGEVFIKKIQGRKGPIFLTNKGGVFSSTDFYGSYYSLPPESRQGEREFIDIVLRADGGYTLISTLGETYSFKGPGAQPTAEERPLGPPPPPGEVAPELPDAREQIRSILGDLGLPQAELADWAWNRYLDTGNLDQVVYELRQRPEHKARFPAFEQLSREGRAMSEGDMLGYERNYRELLQSYGLSDFGLDDPTDIGELLLGNVSSQEIGDRLERGFAQVVLGPPETRQAFGELVGPQSGDAAYALLFLDPDRGWPRLEKFVQTSIIAGKGRRQGINVGLDDAEHIGTIGFTPDQVESGFAQVNQLSPAFNERVSEGQDLTAEETGTGAVFNLNPEDRRKVERRLEERLADVGGRGGVQSLESGVVGQGSAR